MAPLDSPSFPLDGRYHSDEVPAAQGIHITRGDSREHRPDLNQVMLELIVDAQAGIPVLMKPLSGNSRDAKGFGSVVSIHIDPWPTSSGTTYLVADSALYRAANLQQLAKPRMKWSTRVPGPLSEAQEGCTHANPARMPPLEAGDRFQAEPSPYGGVAQRWVVLSAEPRRQQAQRTVAQQWGKPRDKESQACKQLCRRPFACAADAQQALADFGHG